jgi:uncharacterized protein
MRTIWSVCLVTIAVLLPHTVCLADNASHRRAAEALLTVIEAERDIQQDADRLLENLLRQHPQLASHTEAVKTFIMKYMHWPSLKEEVITLYVQAFTEDELQQLTKFYRSPLGQKAADKMPELVNAGTQLGITRLREHGAELEKIIGAAEKKPN